MDRFEKTHRLPVENSPSGGAEGAARRTQGPACWRLLQVSFISLFVELMLIRWIPSTVHVVAFFNNLVLIACFLGLGIGMARAADVSGTTRRAFIRLAIVVAVLTGINIINPSVFVSEAGDDGVNEYVSNLLVIIPMPVVLLAVFALVAWSMIPIGQLIAVYFDRMERITAYSINVVGSLLGVLAFSATALLGMPPLLWFAWGLGLLWLLTKDRLNLVVGLCVLGLIAAQHVGDTRGFQASVSWSPYYKVISQPVFSAPSTIEDGFTVQVNDQFLLSGLDLRDDAVFPPGADPKVVTAITGLRSYYNFPFRLRPAGRVLILGAGAGNDVAAALRHGAEHVTAVEIDPVVLGLGRAHHPEHPYTSPRVQIVNDDARSFLNRTRERFDLIVFATLDSHGLLSSVGNLRLDGFIYTKESLAAARDCLAPGGLMVLSFGPFREEVQYRQYATVRSVFGEDPLYFRPGNDHRILVAGSLASVGLTSLPSGWARIDDATIAAGLARYPHASTPATDDWPHLYLRQKRVPREYLWVLAGIVAFSALLVATHLRAGFSLDGHFLFLGAGFLLLETKSVTEFALLAGSTWQVNSAVFVVILLTILAANLLVLRFPRRAALPWCYGAIVAILLAEYFWPIGRWASGTGAIAYPLAAAYLGTPVFLAALIFATTFREAKLGSAALASNLLGSVLGGTSEYASLSFGIRSLSLLATAMYVGSLCFHAWRRRPEPEQRSSSIRSRSQDHHHRAGAAAHAGTPES